MQETVQMWENLSLILILTWLSQLLSRQNHNKLKSRSKRNKLKPNSQKARKNNNLQNKNQSKPNKLNKQSKPLLNLHKALNFRPQETHKEKKPENRCQGLEQELHKDLNSPKITMPSLQLSNKLICYRLNSVEKYFYCLFQ